MIRFKDAEAKTETAAEKAAAKKNKGGRPATRADKPWLAEGMSRASWYRRQKEKT